MTIRAKLYVAIVLTVVGPVVTVAVALFGMSQMGDRFDDVQARSASRALALQLKYGVTDVNGWQTAYGYDDGASRPEFDRSVQRFRADLVTARRTLTGPRERELLARLDDRFAAVHAARRGRLPGAAVRPAGPGAPDLPGSGDHQLPRPRRDGSSSSPPPRRPRRRPPRRTSTTSGARRGGR